MRRGYGGQARQNQGPAPNEIGAAWIKQTQDGAEYISISFNENAQNFDLANCFVDMYANEYKQKESHPDYRLKAKPKQQQPRRGPARRQQQRQQIPRPQTPRPRNFAPQAQNEAPMPESEYVGESDSMGYTGDDDGGGNY